MTYTTTSNPIIISREAYSDLGAMDRTAAATFCGQKFGVTSRDFQPCVDHYAAGKPGDYVPGAAGGGSTLSQVGGFFATILGGAVNSYATAKGAGGMPVVIPSAGPPSWLMPVAIGGIGLVAFMMLRRRPRASSGPVSNPARRRRRKHRRSRRRSRR